MDSNLRSCFRFSHCAYLLHFLIWKLIGEVVYSWTVPIFLISAIFLIILFHVFLEILLEQENLMNGTPILDQCLRRYKIGLGCITFGNVMSFLMFSMFEVNSSVLSLYYYACSTVPITVLSVLINCSLDRSNLDTPRINRVAYNMKSASVASVIFTLMLICFKISTTGSNKFIYLLQQVACVLGNFPFYIELFELMTLILEVDGDEDEEAIDLDEEEEEIYNDEETLLDDSYSSDESETESDDEQLPNFPTNITLSYEDLQCNVCFLQYSEKRRLPLVLTKCGHSLCRKCCKATQQRDSLGRFINCPFCRTETPGSIRMLPKNYAILGIVQKFGHVGRES